MITDVMLNIFIQQMTSRSTLHYEYLCSSITLI